MPIAHEKFLRRRLLLGFSQYDLAVVAGVSEQTVGRIERGQAPNGGGNITIDIASRLCAALQMELHELILPPEGNKYEAAVKFAHREHSPLQAPHLHDQGRSVKAQGIRRMTGALTVADEALLARPDRGQLDGPDDVIVTNDEGEEIAMSEVLRAQRYRLARDEEARRALEDSQAPAMSDHREAAEEAAATGQSDWNFGDPSSE